jgi:hypothetical protein
MAIAVELENRQAGQVAQNGNGVIYVLHDQVPPVEQPTICRANLPSTRDHDCTV